MISEWLSNLALQILHMHKTKEDIDKGLCSNCFYVCVIINIILLGVFVTCKMRSVSLISLSAQNKFEFQTKMKFSSSRLYVCFIYWTGRAQPGFWTKPASRFNPGQRFNWVFEKNGFVVPPGFEKKKNVAT